MRSLVWSYFKAALQKALFYRLQFENKDSDSVVYLPHKPNDFKVQIFTSFPLVLIFWIVEKT